VSTASASAISIERLGHERGAPDVEAVERRADEEAEHRRRQQLRERERATATGDCVSS
jgi:hypothetical protein